MYNFSSLKNKKQKQTNKKFLLTFLTRQVYNKSCLFFFFWSEKVFISPSPLKGNFTEYGILGGWGFFSLNSLNILMHSPLVYMTSSEKSDVLTIFAPL